MFLDIVTIRGGDCQSANEINYTFHIELLISVFACVCVLCFVQQYLFNFVVVLYVFSS